MMTISRIQSGTVLFCLLSATLFPLFTAADLRILEEAKRCPSASSCPRETASATQKPAEILPSTISRTTTKASLGSSGDKFDVVQESQIYNLQHPENPGEQGPVTNKIKETTNLPKLETQSQPSTATDRGNLDKEPHNSHLKTGQPNNSEKVLERGAESSSAGKRKQREENTMNVFRKPDRVLTGGIFQPSGTARRRRGLHPADWFLVPISSNNGGFMKRASTGPEAEMKPRLFARDTTRVWDKRPRVSPDDGGPKRNWRTNLMRVWGKRDGGIILFEGIQSFSGPEDPDPFYNDA